MESGYADLSAPFKVPHWVEVHVPSAIVNSVTQLQEPWSTKVSTKLNVTRIYLLHVHLQALWRDRSLIPYIRSEKLHPKTTATKLGGEPRHTNSAVGFAETFIQPSCAETVALYLR